MNATPTPTPALARRIVAAIAGAVATGLLAWGAWMAFESVVSQPVTHVVYAGAVDRLAPAELEALAARVKATPTASLEEFRAAARRVPWVRDAAVRRVLPDGIEITFVAHTAFARWNDAQLVSRDGEVFAAPGGEDLPRLRGPDSTALQVVREYEQAVVALAPLDAPIAEFRLSPRGAWHATLASGLAISLGRGDWRPRAERFVASWPKLSPEARATGFADLRYSSGFAMKRAALSTEKRGSER